MEKIIHNKILIAIRIKKLKNGVVPITDPHEPLQILSHKQQKGDYSTKAHIHVPKTRITKRLQECLVVIKGKIKIDLYASNKEFFRSIYLSAGQTVIFINGGHAVHVLNDSEIIEVKNGPFVGDKEMIKYE